VSDLTTLLGKRQAQIMRHLWMHGPATVRELHTALAINGAPRYTTMLSICRLLLERGLLERRRMMADERTSRAKQAHVYAPRMTEAAVLRRAEPPAPAISHHRQNGSDRAAIERLLAYLGTLRALDGQPVDERALDTITMLLERAEAAERVIAMYQAEALRALHRAECAERRAEAAPAPTPARAKPVPSAAVYEYSGRDGICRVCGRPAPPPSGKRLDDLRVCALESCRQEARRRDNVAKQRRCVARQREQRRTLA